MMNRAHPLAPPVGGGFSFYSLLPGVTLRSPPAVFWPPHQGLYALTRGAAREFKDFNDNKDIKDARNEGLCPRGTRLSACLKMTADRLSLR